MTPVKSSLFAALVAVVVTAGALYWWQQKCLREARHLQSENNRLRLAAYQRSQAARPAAKPSAVVAEPPSTPVRAESNLVSPTAPKSVEYYRNEGNATPLAALQTFAWACDRGDVEAVGRLLYIDDAARPKAEAFMASLPANARAQWKTVNEMAAAVLTREMMANPFPNADILETATPEPVGADRIRLRMPNVPKDGTEYVKTAEGWKYVLTEATVDRYLRFVAEQAKTGR